MLEEWPEMLPGMVEECRGCMEGLKCMQGMACLRKGGGMDITVLLYPLASGIELKKLYKDFFHSITPNSPQLPLYP